MKNRELYLEALESADDIAHAVKSAGSKGLLYSEGARLLGVEYHRFHKIAQELVAMGRLKLINARLGNQHQLVLPDWSGPEKSVLTENQQKLFDVMCMDADQTSHVQMSRKEMTQRAGVKSPTFLLDRLDYKGFIQFIDYGGPLYAARFKIFPKGDGPRGYSWRPLNHNRRLMEN